MRKELDLNSTPEPNKINRSNDIYKDLANSGMDDFVFPFEQSSILCWRSTVDGKRYYFNKAWMNFTGRSIEQESNNGWLTGILEHDKNDLIEIYEKAVEAGTSYKAEYRLVNVNGDYHSIVEHGNPIYNNNGDYIGFIGLCYDISSHREKEQKIKQEYEEIYTSLYENNMATMLLIDPESGRIVDANKAACNFYGYTKEVLTSKTINDLNMLSDVEVHKRMKSIQAGKQTPFYLRHRLSNGEIRDVQAYTGTIRTQGKTLFYGIIHDITDRSKSEEALNLAYSELNQIFNTTANGMRVIDINQKITKMNDTMLAKLGLTKEQAVGRKCSELYPGEHCDTPNCPLNRIKNGENRVEFESLKRLKDGTEVPCLVTATPYYDIDGKLLGIIEDFTDLSERKKTEDRIKQIAYHDPLTNLPNRLLLNDRIELALRRMKETNKILAVIFIDLDEFKYINDTYGHFVGDKVLLAVANRFKSLLRETDTIARVGGDEFTILLDGLENVDKVSEIAYNIINRFEAPFKINEEEIFISLTIGVSVFPYDGEDVESLIKHADIALYQAKEQGKNSVQFFTASSKEDLLSRLMMENHLRHAIDKDELSLHYQPQICLNTGDVVGVEALLRWNSEALGYVPPSEFIPLAEDTGYINQLGKWVLYSAAKEIKKWETEGMPIIRVAINISVRQLQDKDFIETVSEVIKETGINPKHLELEITESIALKNLDYNIMILKQLKDMGIKISLDDFGTGYSSLSYLKMLPIDILKIDKSFVQNLSSEVSNKAIATAIISMAHSLNLKVIAEGVETEEQLRFLRDQNCDMCQGYYFSKPVPADKLISSLIAKAI